MCLGLDCCLKFTIFNRNLIDDITQIHFLEDNKKLYSLTLDSNEICNFVDYRKYVCNTLKQLEYLDDIPVKDEDRV